MEKKEEKKQVNRGRIVVVVIVVAVAIIAAFALFYFFTTCEKVEYAAKNHTHTIADVRDFDPNEYVRKDQLDSLFSSWLKRQKEKEEKIRIEKINKKIAAVIPEMSEEIMSPSPDKIREIAVFSVSQPWELYGLYTTQPYTPNEIRKIVKKFKVGEIISLAQKIIKIIPENTIRENAAMLVALSWALKPYRKFAAIEERLEPDAEDESTFHKVREFKNSILDSLSKNDDPLCVKVLRNLDLFDYATKVASSLCSDDDVAKYKEEMEGYVEEQLGPISAYSGVSVKKTTKTAQKTTNAVKKPGKRPRW